MLPARAALLSRVEDAGINASATPCQRWLDGWLLRFNPGKAKRARCINALAPGRLGLSEKLASCEQAYADATLPLILRITPFSAPAALDEALAEAGWRRFDDTRVMVLDAVGNVAGATTASFDDGCTLEALAPDRFAQTVGALRGSPSAQREAHAHRLRHSPVPSQGFCLWRGGDVVACGQFVREDDLVGLYDVFTAPQARGRGLARTLCTEMLRRAHTQGARRAYLQVEGDNHPARAVYHRLGFGDAYAYHYRTRDPHAA